MTNEVLVPEIPTDETLPALFPERPDWQALEASVTGRDGKALVDDDFGEAVIAELHAEDTAIKNYLPKFETAFEHKFGWFLDIAAKISDVRTRERNLCKLHRNVRARVVADWQMEIDRRAEATRIALEQEQQRQAEALKAAAVQAAQAAGNSDEAAAIAAEPVIPASVSMEQAKQGLPQSPKGSSSSKIYKRTITDWALFFRWQAANPQLAATAYTAQADGTYRLSFNSAQWKRSKMEIPGVKCEEDRQVSNRGK